MFEMLQAPFKNQIARSEHRLFVDSHHFHLMKKSSIILLSLAFAVSTLSSCLPLAAGAAAGYVAHKEGYRVQSPIKKNE